VEYLKAGRDAGLDVDKFARGCPFLGIGMNFFMEVAKLRAGRCCGVSWSPSSAPRIQIAVAAHPFADIGLVADRQDAFNNVARTCVEAMAATQGHTSRCTPTHSTSAGAATDFSARIARNTQLLLQQESGTIRPIDPWAAPTTWSG